jgi:CubicO group peptidase (beta-lactamase class C family)
MPDVAGLVGAALVTRAGSVRAELAAGPAEVEAGLPNSAGTRFQLCSISKQFTAAAVLLLAEDGRLDLHEPVTRWLPGAPPPWRQVTLHHVLSHTAGIPHWNQAPGLDPSQPVPPADRLAAITAAPLRTAPGEGWHYSSPGFILAGQIAERAAGQPYPEFVNTRILVPLGLTETTTGHGPPGASPAPPGAARGYAGGQPVPSWDLTSMPGTGDLWSTARDLTRFVTALHTGQILSPASLGAMCTPHAPLDDDDDESLITTGYGYGMFTGTFAGQAARYHPGDNPGYQSFAVWLPDRSASIVILANDEAVDMTMLVRKLLPLTAEADLNNSVF